MYLMGEEHKLPFIEIGVDRGELERRIRDAFTSALGQEEIFDVYVSKFPYEYGAFVLLKHQPPEEAESVALEQEEEFRQAGINLGILVRQAHVS